jgi:hypothetical protein
MERGCRENPRPLQARAAGSRAAARSAPGRGSRRPDDPAPHDSHRPGSRIKSLTATAASSGGDSIVDAPTRTRTIEQTACTAAPTADPHLC